MVEVRAESKFFGGSQYLERLDAICRLFNDADIMDNIYLMYRLMYLYKTELACYMKKDEIENMDNKLKESFDMYKDYLKETEDNKRKKGMQKNNPYSKVILNATSKNKLRLFLLKEIREPLQIIQKKAGLLMADKMSHTDAFMSGLN